MTTPTYSYNLDTTISKLSNENTGIPRPEDKGVGLSTLHTLLVLYEASEKKMPVPYYQMELTDPQLNELEAKTGLQRRSSVSSPNLDQVVEYAEIFHMYPTTDMLDNDRHKQLLALQHKMLGRIKSVREALRLYNLQYPSTHPYGIYTMINYQHLTTAKQTNADTDDLIPASFPVYYYLARRTKTPELIFPGQIYSHSNEALSVYPDVPITDPRLFQFAQLTHSYLVGGKHQCAAIIKRPTAHAMIRQMIINYQVGQKGITREQHYELSSSNSLKVMWEARTNAEEEILDAIKRFNIYYGQNLGLRYTQTGKYKQPYLYFEGERYPEAATTR